MSKIVALVPNRIDRDPAVIMGVTAPEIYTIAWVSAPVFLLSSVVFGMVFQSFFGGLLLGFVSAIASLFGGVVLVARFKRNKPPHYLTHYRLTILGKFGVKPTPFLHQSQRYRAIRD